MAWLRFFWLKIEYERVDRADCFAPKQKQQYEYIIESDPSTFFKNMLNSSN